MKKHHEFSIVLRTHNIRRVYIDIERHFYIDLSRIVEQIHVIRYFIFCAELNAFLHIGFHQNI